jgi:hypothetical protein
MYYLNNEKRPRHYISEIMALKTREERKAALDRVPEEYREWVRTSVVNFFELRKYSP